jgi:hypothetical protein
VNGGTLNFAVTGISCAPSCADPTTEHVVCTGHPSVCPPGTTCGKTGVLPGYDLCL